MQLKNIFVGLSIWVFFISTGASLFVSPPVQSQGQRQEIITYATNYVLAVKDEERKPVRINEYYITLSPEALISYRKNFVLIYTHYIHNIVNSQVKSSGELYAQLLDRLGHKRGKAVLLATRRNEIGMAAAVAVPAGFVIAFTPGAVGNRSVEILAVDIQGDKMLIGKAHVLSSPPGNPFFLGFVRSENVLGLAYEGNDAEKETLIFRLLTLRGEPIKKFDLNVSAMHPHLIATSTGFLLAWDHQEAGIGLLLLERSGKRQGSILHVALNRYLHLVNLWTLGNELQIVLRNSTGGTAGTKKLMGMYLARLQMTGKLLHKPIPLIPLSDRDPHFGTASAENGIIACLYQDGSSLHFGLFRGVNLASIQVLSNHSGGIYVLTPTESGFAAVWPDNRNDTSERCTKHGDCVQEIYFAAFTEKGVQTIAPTRVTTSAQSKTAMNH